MTTTKLFWIATHSPPNSFPDVQYSMSDPNGLLAAGGDLNPDRLLCAYRQGIFPWFNNPPILWWSPDPRTVLFPQQLHIARRLHRRMRSKNWQLRYDTAFEQVIDRCALSRRHQAGTWITDDMIAAYTRLHHLGYAHSIEVWDQQRLIGGLYGVVLGSVFFGESMFSMEPDTSKVALNHLCRSGFRLIDCQVHSDHLQRMGASQIPRQKFCALLDQFCNEDQIPIHWAPS